MMVGQLPFQSFLQLGNLPAQLPLGEIGKLVRIGLPFYPRLNHGPAGDAHHIAGHRGQLDVGIFQDFLNPIDGARLFFHQLRPVPREVSQLALRTRGNEAPFQQSALQQLRDPLAVPYYACDRSVRFAAHRLRLTLYAHPNRHSEQKYSPSSSPSSLRRRTSKGETLCSACSRLSEATIWGSERCPGQTL